MLTSFKAFSESTNRPWFATAFVVLRIVLGVVFLYAGITKFGDWSAAGYLAGATGPFADFFQSLAGNVIVDALNVWGALLIGLGLMTGLLVRPASFFGIVLMLLYYFAGFESNTAHGLIDEHIIYSLILVVFMAGGAGHVFGLDGLVRTNMRKQKKGFVKWLFA